MLHRKILGSYLVDMIIVPGAGVGLARGVVTMVYHCNVITITVYQPLGTQLRGMAGQHPLRHGCGVC